MRMHRHDFSSLWGQYPGLGPLRDVVELATLCLGIAAFFLPRSRTIRQVAALTGAIVIAEQLTVVHWTYCYVAWFAPAVLAVIFGIGVPAPGREREANPSDRERPGGELPIPVGLPPPSRDDVTLRTGAGLVALAPRPSDTSGLQH